MVVTFRSSFEGFFASKGAAYALPDGDFARRASKHGGMWICSSDYSCFWSLFRKKIEVVCQSKVDGNACNLLCLKPISGEMQLHLQAMVNLLRDEDELRLVRLSLSNVIFTNYCKISSCKTRIVACMLLECWNSSPKVQIFFP